MVDANSGPAMATLLLMMMHGPAADGSMGSTVITGAVYSSDGVWAIVDKGSCKDGNQRDGSAVDKGFQGISSSGLGSGYGISGGNIGGNMEGIGRCVSENV
jgi:hypothetical protein